MHPRRSRPEPAGIRLPVRTTAAPVVIPDPAATMYTTVALQRLERHSANPDRVYRNTPTCVGRRTSGSKGADAE